MAVDTLPKRRYRKTLPFGEERRFSDVKVAESELARPTVSADLRIAPERGGVAIWSKALFNAPPLNIFGSSCPEYSACRRYR